jgi:hypothetical protein
MLLLFTNAEKHQCYKFEQNQKTHDSFQCSVEECPKIIEQEIHADGSASFTFGTIEHSHEPTVNDPKYLSLITTDFKFVRTTNGKKICYVSSKNF